MNFVCSCDFNKYTMKVLLDRADKLEQENGESNKTLNEDSDEEMLLIRVPENEASQSQFSDEEESDSGSD